jgi:hypothetical protein
MPWYFVLARLNGDTYPCCYTSLSVGNWRRDGLKTVWNNDAIRNLRAELFQNRLADLCLNTPSCPITKNHIHKNTEKRIHNCGIPTRFTKNKYLFSVSDPEFRYLVKFGVYEKEFLEEEKTWFRWLSQKAIFEIPNKFLNEPYELSLKIRTLKPDIKSSPSVISISLPGQSPKIFSISTHNWKTVRCRFPESVDMVIELAIDCDHCWSPKDYYDAADNRQLGVMLSEIALRSKKGVSKYF